MNISNRWPHKVNEKYKFSDMKVLDFIKMFDKYNKQSDAPPECFFGVIELNSMKEKFTIPKFWD